MILNTTGTLANSVPAAPLARFLCQSGKEKKFVTQLTPITGTIVDSVAITRYSLRMETVNVTLTELATLDIDWGFSPGDSDFPHDSNPWFDAEIADAA